MSKFEKWNILGLGTIVGLLLLITTVVLPFGAPTTAQQSSLVTHDHSNVINIVVDGRVNPELIKDKDAYRLFLLAVSVSDDSAAELERQRGMLAFLQLDDNQFLKAHQIIADFTILYDQAVAIYNQAAFTATANGQSPDLKPFRVQRDSIVRETVSELSSVLGPKDSLFDAYIQSEKRKMKVGVEDSGDK